MEARSVFDDSLALDVDDPAHSEDEERFVIIGESERRRVLIVVYCELEVANIRIISARRATPSERRNYEQI